MPSAAASMPSAAASMPSAAEVDITPLRIQKSTNPDDPDTEGEPELPTSNHGTHPLSEVSPMEGRRNSPAGKTGGDPDDALSSSPFPSPLPTGKTSSPRAFWQVRDRQGSKGNSPSVGRRSSIERLKRASRVQNNTKLFNKPDSKPARPLSYHAGQPPPFSNSPPLARAGSFREAVAEQETIRTSLTHQAPDTPMRECTPPPTKPLSSILSSSPNKSSLLSSQKFSEDSGVGESNHSPVRRPKSVTWDKDEPHVLEYEMVTPDPSVDGGSPYAEYDSDDYEDEEDLENTPVIEPDGWSSMTSEAVSHQDPDDHIRSTPSPNGRPLPPIPGLSRSDSASPSGARPLPSPPGSKSGRHSDAATFAQQHLRLLVEKDEGRRHSWDATARRRSHSENQIGDGLGILLNMPRPNEVESDMSHDLLREDMTSDRDETSPNSNREHDGEESASSQYESASEYEPPQLSRESIRRQVEQRRCQFGSDVPGSVDEEPAEGHYSSSQSDGEDDVCTSPEASQSDIYAAMDSSCLARPESRFSTRSPDPDEVTESETSVYGDDDDQSKYSDAGEDDAPGQLDGTETPTLGGPVHPETALEQQLSYLKLQELEAKKGAGEDSHAPTVEGIHDNTEGGRVSLPDFESLLDSNGLGLKEYMTPSPPLPATDYDMSDAKPENAPSTSTAREFFARSDDELSEDESDTGSVIRHKIKYSDEEDEEDGEDGEDRDEEDGVYEEDDQGTDNEVNQNEDEEEHRLQTRSPSPVAESIATIRAPGGKLKTRASATPADMAAMAAARRQVSGEYHKPPPVPRIPNGYKSEGEVGTGGSSDEADEEDGADGSEYDNKSVDKRISKKKTTSVLPALGEFEFDLKLDDLNDEFERVIEKQKRGYLMRQNTKVVHATSHDPDEDKSSPQQKLGHARGQSWSVEPWRSSQRRRSQRDSLGVGLKKRPSNVGPVPPLPGKESVATTQQRLPSVDETGRSSLGSAQGDNVERGRLFVKVMGVKDLGLPLPQGQPTYFCLTLDNGLHCVTTSWLELGKNAPIGQEFELVVLNDLEFQLTLQTKLEQPPPAPPKTVAKAPIIKPKQKQSAFSKVFSSPKKRKQLELAQQQALQEQQQQQQQRQSKQDLAPVTAWDLLHGLVARDGSFARSYVCLRDFENRAYGRPFTTDIHCFNEWAVDTASVKSKKGVQGGLQPARKAPYKIGKLEVQLFFVPKPRGATDKDLPKSMNAAIRELREAERIMTREWEGNLSQQGGDCPFWRRRYFKLKGARLTAYHEATRQPRATINLSKAVKLIDDRHKLVENTVSGPGKTRRKSGFSEDEEGYMFVEEGFRIRFANGEVIDFYADSAEEKRGWQKILSETIGHVPDSRGWCQVILAKETKARAEREKKDAATEKLRAAQQQISRGPPPVNSGYRIPAPPNQIRRSALDQQAHR